MPSLGKKALCHPVSMSLKGLLGTYVASATLCWWGSLGPLLNDASNSPTTGHNRCRVHPSASCPGCKWWHSFKQGMPDLGQEEEAPCD